MVAINSLDNKKKDERHLSLTVCTLYKEHEKNATAQKIYLWRRVTEHDQLDVFVFNIVTNFEKKRVKTGIPIHKPRPDNSAKDNSADLKFLQFSQKYADNSANNCDCCSRANVLQACQQRGG